MPRMRWNSIVWKEVRKVKVGKSGSGAGVTGFGRE